MRLGDLDALKTDFQHRLEKAKRWKEHAVLDCNEEIEIRATATIDFIIEVIMTINNAPSIEERLQGEWLKNAHEIYKCSLCGAFGNPNYFRFCPECGAYMRGGAE